MAKPADNKTRPANQSHEKPFFSRKVGLADCFKLYHSTQPTWGNTSHAVDASSSLESLGDVSPSVGRSAWIGLQNLPTGQIRRTDTETGQRAPITGCSQLAGTPYRDPAPENGTRLTKATEKLWSPWKCFTIMVICYTSVQTLAAIILGGVPAPFSFKGPVLYGAVWAGICIFVWGLVESGMRLRSIR